MSHTPAVAEKNYCNASSNLSEDKFLDKNQSFIQCSPPLRPSNDICKIAADAENMKSLHLQHSSVRKKRRSKIKS